MVVRIMRIERRKEGEEGERNGKDKPALGKDFETHWKIEAQGPCTSPAAGEAPV